MAIKDEVQVRAWCIDYSLRLSAPNGRLSAERVIRDAAKLEQYITGRPNCEISLLETPHAKPPNTPGRRI